MNLFVTVFLIVFSLLNVYIYKRLICKLSFGKYIGYLLKFFLLMNFLGIISYVGLSYFIAIPKWLYFLISLPVGLLFVFFCVALIYDLSNFSISKIPMSNQRREFFKKSFDITSLFFATSLSAKAIFNAKNVTVEIVDIKIKNLKKPYKIAQISDLHIGGLVDGEFIKSVVTKTNMLNADLVVITGDILDTKPAFAQNILEEFTKLKSKFGTYYIVGNHEYFHGISEILHSLKSLGIRVLENENVYIGKANEGFNLAGVYDLFGYRAQYYMPDLEKALNDLKKSPTVLLAHQPKYISEVKSRVDLMLSGHTHGGQIYPFKYLVKLDQPYISGLHNHTKDLQIYVNKGTGFWGPPMRLGASAEITDINLIPA